MIATSTKSSQPSSTKFLVPTTLDHQIQHLRKHLAILHKKREQDLEQYNSQLEDLRSRDLLLTSSLTTTQRNLQLATTESLDIKLEFLEVKSLLKSSS